MATEVKLGASTDEPPVVDTRSGRLLGKNIRSKYFSGTVQAFLGVPFAQPPVGELRLALPQPITPWEGVRDATKYGAGCPHHEDQVRTSMEPWPIPETELSEDCLYLDIYTPDTKGRRAVVVSIHGGGFAVGKGSILDGSALAGHGDIVAVSINYRLGIFGFLQNYNGNWPANLGIRDQQLALRWVQDNIAAFGGDPDNVTIAGESAGATSVSLHILSPLSSGLFKRAIVQSGSVFTFSTTAKVDLASIAIGMLGCSSSDPDSTLACLRSKTAEEILETGLPGFLIPDGETFPMDPVGAYTDGNVSKVDLLIGVVENEGYMPAKSVFPSIASEEIDMEAYKQQLTGLLNSMYGNNVEQIYKETVDRYFGGDLAGHCDDFVRQQTVEIVGSIYLAAPTHLVAQYHSDLGAKTFFYRFAHQPSFLSGHRPSWHTGECDHSFELVYTMGLPLMQDLLAGPLDLTETDTELSKVAMQYWVNFIKTGNPNGEGLLEWKPFTRQNEDYIVLKPNCQQASVYKPDDMAFWNQKLRKLDKPTSSKDEL